MKKSALNSFIVIALFISTSFFSCDSDPFTVEKSKDGLLIKENDLPVLFYQAETKTLNGKYPRANYVHPLYNLNGNIITEDFPEDHYHHRGIFWTWHQIWIGKERIGDAWLCENFIWTVTDLTFSISENNATIKSSVEWKSENWKDGNEAFAEEEVNITINKSSNEYRVIDFDILITAFVDSLAIGGSEDVKGYGGFSTRILLPEDMIFESTEGLVEPQNTAINAGPWMNMNGSFDESGKTGFAIIQHPDNSQYIQPWILRSSNSMQNPVFPGQTPFLIQRDSPLQLKYRIVLYNGGKENFNSDHFGF